VSQARSVGDPSGEGVPLLDLQAQYRPLREEILAALTRVADSQRFILGEEVETFEREMCRRLEVEHAIAVSSGTDALLVALMALGVGPGAEVITPTYSFFATAGCVSRLGARPVFVDIDPATFNLAPAAVRRAITPRTKAIIPVHLFGLSADLEPIVNLAAEHGIHVVEDAAQAIGARYHGEQVGRFGAVNCFSFFPSKNLGAFGDAGLVVTKDPSLAREVRLLRMHGADPANKYVHLRIGGNFRMDAIQAAVLRIKAAHLTAWTDARRRNADRYRDLIERRGLARLLELPVEPPGYSHIYNQFVIRGPERDRLRTHLSRNQIGTEIYYPVPFHRQECFLALGHPTDGFPIADRAANSSLALPIYGELTLEQQTRVVDVMASFYEQHT
jgi:dTDP-4-amino-4,6-dideoxygalactose transaminase